MPIKRLNRVILATGICGIILAAGCFQPAGAGLEATSLAQALPTFTPIPTEAPTETWTAEPTIFETPTDTPSPTIEFILTSTPEPGVTEVAMAQDIEPIWQTATAIYLQQVGGVEPPTQQPPAAIDPLLLTATELVRGATLTAEWPLTATAAALLGPSATPTFPPFQPTNTNAPILNGADCIHQVQPDDGNLFRISLLYGIHYLDIAYYPPNSIVNPNLIYIGQQLIIPGCGVTGHVPPPTWTPTATYNYPTYTGGTAYPTYSGQYPTYTGQPFNYVVRPGDTLFRLSLTYGVPVASILARNPQIVNLNLIYVGDTIVIG